MDPFRTERQWILLLIMAVAWYLRGWDPFYSTAYMDETIYVVYGRMFLSGVFEAPLAHPLRYSFGWYLWPSLAAIAAKIGGIPAVRELGAALGVLTVFCVYPFTRRLFSRETGLAAAALLATSAPAVYASRIATRDAGALAFFALGMWLYVKAWQERKLSAWLWAGLALFAAFLCKYVVAIYFPFLVLLAFRRGRNAFFGLILPLTAACAAYAGYYHDDLLQNIRYGQGYSSLMASPAEALQIYFFQRFDFWVLLLLSLLALQAKDKRREVLALFAGAGLMLAFQAKIRPDFDYWKHAAYPMFFLAPTAAEGLLHTVHRFSSKRDLIQRAATSGMAVLAAALIIGWLGSAASLHRFIFWPNVDPILAFMDGRITPNSNILVDDSVFRYYFAPPLHQWQITDPFSVPPGDPYYRTAVSKGAYDYVVLDGGMGEEARAMRVAIDRPLREEYTLLMTMPDSQLGHTIEIYARKDPPPEMPPPAKSQIMIDIPTGNSVLKQEKLRLHGWVTGFEPKWNVHAEVFTDRWYDQSTALIMKDGSFGADINLGGRGRQQCYHLVRASLYDQHGAVHARSTVFGLVRANPDGGLPACMPPPPPAAPPEEDTLPAAPPPA